MIKFSNKIKSLDKAMSLGILRADVKVEKSCYEIVELLNKEVERVEKLTLDNYRNETLEASRAIYKALGKDPSRYRISSDSLFRRVIKKKGVYYVNNVVDINNIISMRTLWSVGAYDLEKIEGDIVYGVGNDEIYEGIGRGILNIDKLPVLIDQKGPFGSATSDSLRTMVTEDTKKILMVIHAFGDGQGLEASLNDMKNYLEKYASGENVSITIVMP
jgi:DNA/RNA-binding domain of Phe-tRNA-synthetase-like protein